MIPAAKICTRNQLDILNQYYKLINCNSILDNTLEKFIDKPLFDNNFVAIAASDIFLNNSISYTYDKLVVCHGVVTCFKSVYNALIVIDERNNSDWAVFT
ncbi:2-C-methyl-D-erythritol 4-phosphate cytidylyltransferase, partial [Francisella tularensis subsp. holarctica]|nr:2-C-methyl-D-erythritol 4-phosphate cytidylyltransferase [Francisella tularensis subsp. holarctica]